MWSAEIATISPSAADCPRVSRNGKQIDERGHEARRGREGAAGLSTSPTPAERETELEKEELVEGKRPVCEAPPFAERDEIRFGRRLVQMPKRSRRLHEPMTARHGRRQDRRHAVGEGPYGLLHHPSHDGHGHRASASRRRAGCSRARRVVGAESSVMAGCTMRAGPLPNGGSTRPWTKIRAPGTTQRASHGWL
jgi:hypothetical protein